MNKINISKYLNKTKFLLTLVLLCLLVIPLLQINTTNVNSALEDEKKQIEEDLKNLNEQKQKNLDEIESEKANLNKLKTDSEYIASLIEIAELKIKNIKIELESLNIKVDNVSNEKKIAENELRLIQEDSKKQISNLSNYNNLLYKMSFDAPSILDNDSNFQNTVIAEKKVEAVARLIKVTTEELEKLEKDATEKKDQIASQEQELINMQSEKTAQNNLLVSEQDALNWQKINKEKLAEESKTRQETLVQIQKDLSKRQGELEAKLTEIMNEIAKQPPPIEGQRVNAGDTIGLQGRSGLSCNPLEGGVIKTNTYCEDYGYTGPEWYYYDPIEFPKKGSHLHLIYIVNGQRVYPGPYLSGNLTEFDSLPMDNFTEARGYHEGGAIDLVSYHGAPVKAMKAGIVKYTCINYPPVPEFPDPAYVATVYHDDGTISQYAHLQRNGAPCVYS